MILVTGASGYLGSAVCCVLARMQLKHFGLNSNPKSLIPHCNLTVKDDVASTLFYFRPQAIIHCAAKVPKSKSQYQDVKAAAQSVAMVRNLAEYATCPIVFASSMTAKDPQSAYGRGKCRAEQILMGRDRGDVIVRLPGLFGLPRRCGEIYTKARAHIDRGVAPPTPNDYEWYGMLVSDAADLLVRFATEPVIYTPKYTRAQFANALATFIKEVRAEQVTA